MRRIFYSVDRWGPAVVAIIALFWCATIGWWNSAKIAKLEGQVIALQHQIDEQNLIRSEMAGVSKWMIAVYERGSANGWKLPELPKRQNNSKSKPNNGDSK